MLKILTWNKGNPRVWRNDSLDFSDSFQLRLQSLYFSLVKDVRYFFFPHEQNSQVLKPIVNGCYFNQKEDIKDGVDMTKTQFEWQMDRNVQFSL
jgi:hypothetical protein